MNRTTDRAVLKTIWLEALLEDDQVTNDLFVKKFYPIVKEAVRKELLATQEQMMLEIAIKIGDILRLSERDGRKPLWESRAEEFGLDPEDLVAYNANKRK